MKLITYLSESNERFAAFGRRLPKPRPSQTIRRWALGQRQPDFSDMRDVAVATGYQVMPNDWVFEADELAALSTILAAIAAEAARRNAPPQQKAAA